MCKALSCLAIAVGLAIWCFCAVGVANADPYKWCAQYGGEDGGGTNCGFGAAARAMSSFSMPPSMRTIDVAATDDASRSHPTFEGRQLWALVFRSAQSGFTPVSMTIFCHLATSSLTNAPNCSGVLDCAMNPTVKMRCCTLGSASALTRTAFSLSMIAFGVPFGALSPYQVV
jgi:hypothetical protein